MYKNQPSISNDPSCQQPRFLAREDVASLADPNKRFLGVWEVVSEFSQPLEPHDFNAGLVEESAKSDVYFRFLCRDTMSTGCESTGSEI